MQIHFNFPAYSIHFRLISALLALMLHACAPQPDELKIPESTETVPLIKESAPAAPSRTAVLALVKQADGYIRLQRWPEATATLERAIRIDSYQADIWTRMAIINLGKSNPEQALQMAKKSNSLAKNNISLQAWNWSLMAKAYRILNQPEKAQEAEQIQLRLQQQGAR